MSFEPSSQDDEAALRTPLVNDQDFWDLRNLAESFANTKRALFFQEGVPRRKIDGYIASLKDFEVWDPNTLPAEIQKIFFALKVTYVRISENASNTCLHPSWVSAYTTVLHKLIDFLETGTDSINVFDGCLSILPHIFAKKGIQCSLEDTTFGEGPDGDHTMILNLIPYFMKLFMLLSFRLWHQYSMRTLDADYDQVKKVCDMIPTDLQESMSFHFSYYLFNSSVKICRDFYNDIADHMRFDILEQFFSKQQRLPKEIILVIRETFFGPFRADYGRLVAAYSIEIPTRTSCTCFASEEDLVSSLVEIQKSDPPHALVSGRSLTCPAVTGYAWHSTTRSWKHQHTAQVDRGNGETCFTPFYCRFPTASCNGHLEGHDWILDRDRLRDVQAGIEVDSGGLNIS